MTALPTSRGSVLVLLLAAAAPSAPIPAEAAWLANGTPIATGPEGQYGAVIATDFSGGAVIAWVDGRLVNPGIYAQRIDSTGTTLWAPNGVWVAPHGFNLTAVPTFDGGATIAWTDTRTVAYYVYAQRLAGDGTPQLDPGGLMVSTPSSNSQVDPRMISDGVFSFTDPTGYVVAWAQGASPSSEEIWVQHFDAAGAGKWSPAGTRLLSAGNRNGRVMTTDGAGSITARKGAVLSWYQPGAGTGQDIWVSRINGAGVAPWTADGIPICAVVGDQVIPRIASVGGAREVVAWSDGRAGASSGNKDVYAQKIDSTGATLWQANGVPVCEAPGDQGGVDIASDNTAGGIYAVWDDNRPPGGLRIYAQRLDTNGTAMWAPDGIAVSSSANATTPTIVAFPTGMIVVWFDRTTSYPYYNLFAQRIDPNGQLQWGPMGIPLCRVPVSVALPLGVWDGGEGAIWTWLDENVTNLDLDVYASRTYPWGIVDVPSDSPTQRSFELVATNPSREEVRLRLALPRSSAVRIDVIDPAGRRVRTLDLDQPLSPGSHAITWDGRDDAGARTPSGVYFVVARVGSDAKVSRVVRLR